VSSSQLELAAKRLGLEGFYFFQGRSEVFLQVLHSINFVNCRVSAVLATVQSSFLALKQGFDLD